MARPVKKYGFLNAKLRARISKLLSDRFFERLIEAPDLEAALSLLRGTRFEAAEEVYRTTGDLKMVEVGFFRRELQFHRDVEKAAEGEVRRFAQALMIRYEIEILKGAIRLWFDRVVRGRAVEAVSAYLPRERVVHDLDLNRVIGSARFEDVVDTLSGTPYQEVVREGSAGVADGSIFPVEIGLDRTYYRQLQTAAAELDKRDRKIAERIIGVEIDLSNLEWIVRLRSAYDMPIERTLRYLIPHGGGLTPEQIVAAYGEGTIVDVVARLLGQSHPALQIMRGSPGEESSRLMLIERILQQVLQDEIRHTLVGYPFTIGIVLAYTTLERMEVQRVLTVLNAKFYDLDPDRIRGLL